MSYIELSSKAPGMRGLIESFPDTGKLLSILANELLMRETCGLSVADREFIGGYVSKLNKCTFCGLGHSAIAEELSGKPGMVEAAVCDLDSADISGKLKALLRIAGKIQQDAKSVTTEDFELARKKGASEWDLHDTVLIAAMFCMMNRYVDGLGTEQPEDESIYRMMAPMIIKQGYIVNRNYK